MVITVASVRFRSEKDKGLSRFVRIEDIYKKYRHTTNGEHISPKDSNDFKKNTYYWIFWKDCTVEACQFSCCGYFEGVIECLGESNEDLHEKIANIEKRVIFPKQISSGSSSTIEKKELKTKTLSKKTTEKKLAVSVQNMSSELVIQKCIQLKKLDAERSHSDTYKFINSKEVDTEHNEQSIEQESNIELEQNIANFSDNFDSSLRIPSPFRNLTPSPIRQLPQSNTPGNTLTLPSPPAVYCSRNSLSPRNESPTRKSRKSRSKSRHLQISRSNWKSLRSRSNSWKARSRSRSRNSSSSVQKSRSRTKSRISSSSSQKSRSPSKTRKSGLHSRKSRSRSKSESSSSRSRKSRSRSKSESSSSRSRKSRSRSKSESSSSRSRKSRSRSESGSSSSRSRKSRSRSKSESSSSRSRKSRSRSKSESSSSRSRKSRSRSESGSSSSRSRKSRSRSNSESSSSRSRKSRSRSESGSSSSRSRKSRSRSNSESSSSRSRKSRSRSKTRKSGLNSRISGSSSGSGRPSSHSRFPEPRGNISRNQSSQHSIVQSCGARDGYENLAASLPSIADPVFQRNRSRAALRNIRRPFSQIVPSGNRLEFSSFGDPPLENRRRSSSNVSIYSQHLPLVKEFNNRLYRRYKRLQTPIQGVREKYKRYKRLPHHTRYLGLNIRIGKETLRDLKSRNYRYFLRGIARRLWGQKELALRAIDPDRCTRETKICSPEKTELYLSLYKDFIEEKKKKKPREFTRGKEIKLMTKACRFLSTIIRDAKKAQQN